MTEIWLVVDKDVRDNEYKSGMTRCFITRHSLHDWGNPFMPNSLAHPGNGTNINNSRLHDTIITTPSCMQSPHRSHQARLQVQCLNNPHHHHPQPTYISKQPISTTTASPVNTPRTQSIDTTNGRDEDG